MKRVFFSFGALICFLLLGGLSLSASENRSKSESKDQNEESGYPPFQEVLSFLDEVPTGRLILTQAQSHWGFQHRKDLWQKVYWGRVSRTDAVLTREIDAQTGKEKQKREVKISLKQGQSVLEMALDLVHELVHAIHDPDWDPYDPGLTSASYIEMAIEGKGGEVEALWWECQVNFEFHKKFHVPLSRCERYTAQGSLQEESKESIRKDFYRSGQWTPRLMKEMGEEARRLNLLSSQTPVFFSSTGRTPYPYALYREFEEMNEIACLNSWTRFRSLEEERRKEEGKREVKAGVQRNLAESQESQAQSKVVLRNEALVFLQSRCRDSNREISSFIANSLGNDL
jgi:hypothetical protein